MIALGSLSFGFIYSFICLGISISGGKGSKTQPEVRVEKIFPGGAAADDGRLRVRRSRHICNGFNLKSGLHHQPFGTSGFFFPARGLKYEAVNSLALIIISARPPANFSPTRLKFSRRCY